MCPREQGRAIKMNKRITLAVALATALSLAGASTVLAQDGADVDPEFGRTLNITGIVVDATDPRFSGAMDLAVSSRCFGAEDRPDADVRVLSMRLVAAERSWQGTGVRIAPERNERDTEVWNLSGEDGYEGLSVVLVVGPKVAKAALKGEKLDLDAVPIAWGWILPTTEIPAVPDLQAAE